ncbi:hypothetical protein BHE74_00043465 [Ensete ventricosum]|nr:hypothetical protein BHE74_00043465 [Ensete ventricosum]
MKLQLDNGPKYNLGIRPSSDDAMGCRWKFARRFVEGIRKLAGNAKGDRREERRIYRKIAGGCRRIREVRAAASRCRWVNCPDGYWTTRTTDYRWRPTIDGG